MSIIMELKIEDGNVTGKLKNAEKGIKNLDKVGKKAAAGGLKQLTKTVAGLATAFIGFRTLLDIGRVGITFDTTMRKVKAVSKATNKEMQMLTKTARHLGKTTTFTASQVGDLEHEMAKLGFTAKQINAAAEGVLYMAQATGSDLAQAAEIAGSVLRSFNIDASDTMRVSDVMAMSFTSSALNISRFAESMKYVAPVATSLGISLEETTAVLGELADRGLAGSLSGTALRNVMLRLAGPTSDAAKKLGGMSLQTHTLTEIFEKLRTMGIGAAEAQKLFGLRSASAAAILINVGGPAIKEFTEKLENAAGAAKEMADVKMGGWEGKIRRLSSAFESLQISIFNALAGKGGAIDMLTEVIRLWDKWLNMLTTPLTPIMAVADEINQMQKKLIGYQQAHGKPAWKFWLSDISSEEMSDIEKYYAVRIRVAKETLARLIRESWGGDGDGGGGGGTLPPITGGGLPEIIKTESMEDRLERLTKLTWEYEKAAKKAREAAWFDEEEKERLARFNEKLKEVVKTEQQFADKMQLVKDVTAEFGFMLGSAIFEGKEGLKEGLKNILMVLVSFLEKLYLASIAKASFDIIWGNWGSMAKLVGTIAMFEAAKGAISSWSSGGVVSEAINGRISSGGMISGPGTGTSDSIFARISTGEAILNARAVRNLGADRINYINRSGELPGYAKGGIPGARIENYVGDVYYNFNKTGTDPFTVFKTHRDFVRSRRGTSSLRTTR